MCVLCWVHVKLAATYCGMPMHACWLARVDTCRCCRLPLLPCSRRQLVYAWGDSVGLPALEQRTQVVQALLLGLSDLVDANEPLLNMPGLVLKSGGTADRWPI